MAAQRADASPAPRLTGVLRRLASMVWWTLLVLLVLLAVLVGVGRQLADNLEQYRGTLEAVISAQLGRQVTIGAVTAEWQGPDPVLRARDLHVQHGAADASPAIRLQHLRVRLDSIASLLRLGLVFDRIEADSLDMTLVRDREGAIYLDGLAPARQRPVPLPVMAEPRPPDLSTSLSPAYLISLLAERVSDPHIQLTRVSLGIDTPDEPVFHVDIPQIDLLYEDGEFSASGRAMRPGTVEQLATFTLSGRDFLEGRFQGRLHADISSGRLFDGLAQGLGWRELALTSLDARARAWLSFDQGRLQRINGELALPWLQLSTSQQTLAPLEDVRARIGWRPRPDAGADGPGLGGGEWHLRDLSWNWLADRVRGVDAMVMPGADGLLVRARGVPVGALARLGRASASLPGMAERALANYQPEGTLNNLALRIPPPGSSAFELSAHVAGGQVAAHAGAPRVSGAEAYVRLDSHGGSVTPTTSALTLDFPELFAGAWTLTDPRGQVSWRLDGQRVTVTGNDLSARYQDQTRLSGSFELNLDLDRGPDREGQDTLALDLALRNGNAAMIADFVPAKKVDPEFYQWLTTAITEATITEGRFRGQGPIEQDQPPGSFRTDMEFTVADARLRYDLRWPEVTDISGQVDIANGDADIRIDSARTGGLQLAPGTVRLRSGDDSPRVEVRSGARMNGDQIAFWLAETPLGALAGRAADAITVSGDYDLGLELGIPLEDTGNVAVTATLATDNGRVRYPAGNLVWTGLRGQFSYDPDQGFSGGPLRARFLDHAVAMRLSGGQDGAGLRLTQRGEAGFGAVLARLLPDAAPQTSPVTGTVPYSASLALADGAVAGLALEADTSALAGDLPAPLAGLVAAPEPLKLALEWPGDDALAITGGKGNRLALNLLWGRHGFTRGSAALGRASTGLPEEAGLQLTGVVERLDLGAWQRFVDRLGVQGGPAPGELLAGGGNMAWLNRLRLTIGELLLGRHVFPEVTAEIRPHAGGWTITTESQRAAGKIRLPAGGDVVWLDLDRLRLVRAPDTATAATGPPPALEELGLESWPRMDVRIESLFIGDNELGAWSFALRPAPRQLKVEDLQGQLNSLTFAGNLLWQAAAGGESSRLRGTLEGGDLADLSLLLGEAVPLSNESSNLEFDLNWPGSPDRLELAELGGSVKVRLDNGVLLERSNTAQLFRVFNLLNSDTLQRRLKLDFSDLYEAGVAFDAISGQATLEQGTLAWDPELQVVGPSGAFKLSGSTDLTDETLDMRLVVVLPLTKNLPLAALLLGASAPIGGALFVLDKLLGDPLSKLTSATYSVRGTWDNPEVNLRNMFDTGN